MSAPTATVAQQPATAKTSRRTLRGRPMLYTSYSQEMAMFNTRAKRNWTMALCVAVVVLPFFLQRDMVALGATVFVFAIASTVL